MVSSKPLFSCCDILSLSMRAIVRCLANQSFVLSECLCLFRRPDALLRFVWQLCFVTISDDHRLTTVYHPGASAAVCPALQF
jgi:hypothetical protein